MYSNLTAIPPLRSPAYIVDADFSWNKIEILRSGTFDKWEEVRSINVSNNQLQTIENGVFFQTHKLKILDMSCNLIQTLPTYFLSGISELHYLFIQNNLLISFQHEIFLSLQHVTSLTIDVSGNYNLSCSDLCYIHFLTYKVRAYIGHNVFTHKNVLSCRMNKSNEILNMSLSFGHDICANWCRNDKLEFPNSKLVQNRADVKTMSIFSVRECKECYVLPDSGQFDFRAVCSMGSGKWVNFFRPCKKVYCAPPLNIENGKLGLKETKKNYDCLDTVSYVCHAGYTLPKLYNGSTCVRSYGDETGEWLNIPTCTSIVRPADNTNNSHTKIVIIVVSVLCILAITSLLGKIIFCICKRRSQGVAEVEEIHMEERTVSTRTLFRQSRSQRRLPSIPVPNFTIPNLNVYDNTEYMKPRPLCNNINCASCRGREERFGRGLIEAFADCASDKNIYETIPGDARYSVQPSTSTSPMPAHPGYLPMNVESSRDKL